MPSSTTPLLNTSAENDLSIKLLNGIFGQNWTSATEIGNADTILFELLDDFNKLVLTVVVISFFWTMAIASANTANEGKPLGQKFSTMWVPIRAMLGVSFLVPIFGGLSMFQVGLLQGVEFSIDVANGANKLVHEYFFKDMPSGMVAMEEIPGLKEHSLEVGKLFLKALVTQEYYAQKEGISTEGSTYTIVDDTTMFTGKLSQKIFSFNTPSVSNIGSYLWSAAVMPKVKIPCGVEAGGESICTARVNALGVYSNNLGQVAKSIVSRSLPEPSGLNNDEQIKAFLTAAGQYVADSKNVAMEALQGEVGKEVKDKMDKFYNSGAMKSGWLMLGAYYWIGSNTMSETMQIATDLPKPDEAFLTDMADFSFANGDIDALFVKIDRIIEQADVSNSVLESIDTKKGFLGAYGLADMTTDAVTTWMSGAESGDDVITSMQGLGHWIILGCNAIVTTLGAQELTGGGDKSGDSGGFLGSVLSKAGPAGKALGGVGNLFGKLFKLSVAGLLILYPLGFTLAYMLPAIPLIIWVMAAINWVISVLSLVIGSTIWAAAISLPEGEGVAGNHGREGFMLLANCLLRPFLMVFGFVVSFLLIRFLGGFLQEIFLISSTAMNGQYSRGVVTVIATVGIFGMIIMVAAQKIYGLIVHFPDIILNYVGKHLSGSGEGQDNQKVEGMFRSLGSKGSGFLGGGKG